MRAKHEAAMRCDAKSLAMRALAAENPLRCAPTMRKHPVLPFLGFLDFPG